MAKLGAINFEHIFERQRNLYGKMEIDYSNMVQGRQRGEARDLMGKAMPGLIEQFKGIKAATLQLSDMKTGGYRIPFNEAMNRLNDKEMVLSAPDKLKFAKDLYAGGFGTGAGGGNITIVNAPTQPVTNLSQNSTNINQIQVPESALNNERTFRTVTHGQMALA
jgi:hypothetical protein